LRWSDHRSPDVAPIHADLKRFDPHPVLTAKNTLFGAGWNWWNVHSDDLSASSHAIALRYRIVKLTPIDLSTSC
jgi:hypothetical protein